MPHGTSASARLAGLATGGAWRYSSMSTGRLGLMTPRSWEQTLFSHTLIRIHPPPTRARDAQSILLTAWASHVNPGRLPNGYHLFVVDQ